MANGPETERLKFVVHPFDESATWTQGIMDILIAYHGQPLAFMTIRNGQPDWRICSDNAWTLTCDVGVQYACATNRLLQTYIQEDLINLLKDDMRKGCEELLSRVAPATLGKNGKNGARKKSKHKK